MIGQTNRQTGRQTVITTLCIEDNEALLQYIHKNVFAHSYIYSYIYEWNILIYIC